MKISKKKAKAPKTPKTTAIIAKHWWALVRSPVGLPVLFETRKAAIENQDPDEWLVRVWVETGRLGYTDEDEDKGW